MFECDFIFLLLLLLDYLFLLPPRHTCAGHLYVLDCVVRYVAIAVVGLTFVMLAVPSSL